MPKSTVKRIDSLKKLGFKEATLRNLDVKELTNAERSKILKFERAPTYKALTNKLTCTKPRVGDNFLTFYSPMMVETEGVANGHFALFSSKFPGVIFPAARITFKPEASNKRHLVEFYVTLFNSSMNYKFRLFNFENFTHQDVTLNSQTHTITALVDPLDDYSGDYAVEMQQRNTQTEDAGWMFHYAKVTAID